MNYKTTRVEYAQDAAKYILIPAYNLAIPAHMPTSRSTLLQALVDRGDYGLPAELDAYPLISSAHLHLHFPAYEIIPLLRTISVCVPPGALSETERERRRIQARETAQRDRAERRAAYLVEKRVIVYLDD